MQNKRLVNQNMQKICKIKHKEKKRLKIIVQRIRSGETTLGSQLYVIGILEAKGKSWRNNEQKIFKSEENSKSIDSRS